MYNLKISSAVVHLFFSTESFILIKSFHKLEFFVLRKKKTNFVY